MNNAQPIFYTGGEQFPLDSMLDANADDDEVTEWLVVARVGETRMFGGGAAEVSLVLRVS